MSSHDPPKDIADYLDTNSTAVTLKTNLFYGLSRHVTSTGSAAVPATAVFVVGGPGPPAERVFGATIEIRRANVQVRVRSTGYANGLSLARTVYRTLQSATPSSYMDVIARQSEPTPLGQDEQGLYDFSLNFEVVYRTT